MRRQYRSLVLSIAAFFLFVPLALADYTVTGKFLFEDRDLSTNGFTGAVRDRPIRFADVQITAGTTVLARGATNASGDFSIVVPGSTQQQVRATCVASSTQTPDIKLQVAVASSETSFGSSWTVSSNQISYTGTSTLDMGQTRARYDSDAGRAFNIWDALIDGAEFVASPGVRGSYPSVLFTVAWSRSPKSFGGYYNPERKFAYIGPNNAQDDPLIYQQFGHFIADIYSKLDAPTGFTLLGDDRQDIRAAWAEGLSLFIGASIRRFKGYARPDYYVLTDGSNLLLSFDLESLTSYINPFFNYPPFQTNRGSTSILAVAAALWDATDGPGTEDGSPGYDDDPLQKDFFYVWKVLIDYLAHLDIKGITVERFWDGWFAPAINNGSAAEMQSIFVNSGIEFLADSHEADNSAGQAPLVAAAQLPAAASGAKILICEISLDDGGAVELYNAGDTGASLEGWALSASRGGTTATAFLPYLYIRPGEFITVIGSSTSMGRDRVLFSGSAPIPWAVGQEGACALRDSSGNGRDFVRWGSSREFPPGGTDFTGNNPPVPDAARSLGRNYALIDTDAGSDWSIQAPTLGTYNASGEERHHTFYPAGDVDYAAFNARSGFTYLVETLTPWSGADPVLAIIAADGTTVLATNDDSSLGTGARVVWKASSNARFFIRCSRYDQPPNYAQYGSYDLRIIESAASIRVAQPDTVTVSKPGQGGKYDTIGAALSAAYNGDTVEIIDSGTYEENISVAGKTLTLRAARGKSPVIDGRGKNKGTLTFDAKSVRIESITVFGGTWGILVTSGAAKIVNTIVTRTSEGTGADGIVLAGDGVTADIVHCTVVNNKRVGIAVFNGAKARVVNAVAYGNSQIDIGGDSTAEAGLTVRNTLSVKSNYTSSNGNLTGDPKFVNADTNDYHLQPSSPAVDKADATDPDEPATDADGLGRSLPGAGQAALPDMGAFEYLNPAILTTTAVFPQIAAGGTSPEYRTSVVAVNTGAATSTARVMLTQSDGSPFNVTVLDEGEPGGRAPAGAGEIARNFARSGNVFDISVPPAGTMRLETSGAAATVSGYAKLSSNLPLSGTALFKTLRNGTILSEAGVGLSRPSRNFIVYIDNKSNALSGYAVANAGTSSAGITMTLRDADGTVRQTKNLSLDPGHHFARFAIQDFPGAAGEGFEGTVEFSGDQPVSAVALRYDNVNLDAFSQVFSTIPVLIDEASTTLYFPQVADGGGYRTNFILVNPGITGATAKLEFYDDDGNPLGLPIGGVVRTSHEAQLSSRGAARFLTDGTSTSVKVGWVKVTCPTAIGGSSIFQTLSGNVITSEAGVASSPYTTRFTVYVETVGSAWSGLAVCNPGSSAVDVTLKLRDSSGAQRDTHNIRLPALGHIARFFTQWFGDYPNFEGTLEIVSSAPVSGVALRYDNPGLTVFATLPVIAAQ